MDKNSKVFIDLVQAGLWKKEVQLLPYQDIKWHEVYRLATEQSVLGLVLAGLEHSDVKPPKELLLQWIGEVQLIEQRNKEMNAYVADLIDKLRLADIYTLLVKGQGIAQCYEKPLWRSCGDVDLYLSIDNYRVAKKLLCAKASHIDVEDVDKLHLAMTIDGWVVELHGSMHSDISRRINKGLDEVHNNIFFGGEVRSWNNSGVTVFLPSANNDVIIVFSHILQHFFIEGIGLRQICDWCRLLYTYRDSLNFGLLESRLKKMRVMTEWKAFAALAIDFLGMPSAMMPFYDDANKWKKKGQRILSLILETGTFGHNRDLGYKQHDKFFNRLVKSFKRRNRDSIKQILLFPLDGLWMWWKMIFLGIKVAAKGHN